MIIILKKINGILLILSSAFLLAGCNLFAGTDNTPKPTPLVSFQASNNIKILWSAHPTSGSETHGIVLPPALSGKSAYSTGASGTVAANDLTTGSSLWRLRAANDITTAPGVNEQLLAFGDSHSELLALDLAQGKLQWKLELPNELLAAPALSSTVAVAKTINDDVIGVDLASGKVRWQYPHGTPGLVLRGSSPPVIVGDKVIVGFSDGKLAALRLGSGEVVWMQTVAEPVGNFPVERLVDIAATPVVSGSMIYAGTYQGKLAALHLETGDIEWQQDLSTYSGLCVSDTRVFASDASGRVHAFDKRTGKSLWQQDKLQYRLINAPICLSSTVVVGDSKGYLHAMAMTDGHFVARLKAGEGAFNSDFKKISADRFVATTQDGHLLLAEITH